MKLRIVLLAGMAGLLAVCQVEAAEYSDRLLRRDPVAPQVIRLPPVEEPTTALWATAPVAEPVPPVASAPVPEPAPVVLAPVEQVPADDRVELEVVETFPAPKPEPPPKIWEGSFELGLNGSEGNSQTFNIHLAASGKRKTKYHVFSAKLDCHKNSNDSVETANRAFLDWRYERLFEPSRWNRFVHDTVDYDEFKAFDVRNAVVTGIGHQLIKTEATSLTGRLGSGFSREIGSPDDRYVPEMLFGLDLEHQLTRRQKLTGKVDYFPEIANFNDWRLLSELAWQVVLDEEMNLSLKASLIDRYDSSPENDRNNDLDYALTLLWSY